jgi:flagellar hook-length control protein FliK
MDQSELQVEMKSDSWGPVSVKASLSNGQIGAEIQVSNHDAHAAVAEGLNVLEKTLGDRGIQVVNLDVSYGSGHSYAQSQGQQEKPAGQPPHDAKSYTYRSAIESDPSAASTHANTTDDFVLYRVSVRA